MVRSRLVTLLAACAFAAGAGCLEPPASFERIGLERARELVAAREVTVVEAIGEHEKAGPELRAGVLWRLSDARPAEPPEIPDGPVLVVASNQSLAYRAAAHLARSRNREVRVLITASAEDRGTLYALDPQQEEIPRGRDS